MKIIFIGTPEFGAIILEKLVSAGHKPTLVITETDKPVGRKQVLTPPPVKILAAKNNIPVLQPERIENCKLDFENLKPDLIIVTAYGQIIPKEILDIPKYGCLNIHPSLLPKYRGPSPIQSAILKGDPETGVTIMLMDELLDHGPIISSQKQRMAESRFTYVELSTKLAELGADLLVKTIPDWVEGKVKAQPQDEAKAITTKILTKDDGKIDWQNRAYNIELKIRALNPWPGTYSFWQTRESESRLIKILEGENTTCIEKKKTGEVFLFKDKFAIKCGQNCLIVQKLQLEGGKPMSSQDFLRGHSEIIGTVLN